MDRSQRTFTNRRHLLREEARLSPERRLSRGAFPAHRCWPRMLAPSRLQQVLDRGKLVVGTGSTNPPWHYEDADGQLIGIDIEMAKLFASGLFQLTGEQLANRENGHNDSSSSSRRQTHASRTSSPTRSTLSASS